jgi:hypothetical protein
MMRGSPFIVALLCACMPQSSMMEDDEQAWSQGEASLAAAPAEAAMCKPSHLVAGQDFRYAVEGLEPGQRVAFYFNNGALGEHCVAFADACLELDRARYLGVRVADDSGAAEYLRRMPGVVRDGTPVAMQAYILDGRDSQPTNVVHHVVARAGAAGDGACGDADVCLVRDFDGDGITNACDPCPMDPSAACDGRGCPDRDGDGVCDEVDACPGGDDLIDSDFDGVCDALDACPGGRDDADADGDGVCDLEDVCPGGPDDLDTDADGVCDALDTCPGGDDGADHDGDLVCDALDVCPDADDYADRDHDDVPDACDACPDDRLDDLDGDGVCDGEDACHGHNDHADADEDGIPDGCDWGGAGGGVAPEYYPWREEPPPPGGDEVCLEGDEVRIVGDAAVSVRIRFDDSASIEAGRPGWYDLYDDIAESKKKQLNENAYMRVVNDTNPEGFAYLTNCGDEWVIADSDNDGSTPGDRYLGTFWLDEGLNRIELYHWCDLYEAGMCEEFFNPERGHGCADAKAQSTHLEGFGMCAIRIEEGAP